MQNYFDRTLEFLNNDAGASAVEYALLLTLIAVVIIGGITVFGTNLSAYYQKIVTGLPS
jgi:pilus assembly protein Flp/PilA